MRDLERRIVHLEEASNLRECLCSRPVVVFMGDPEPPPCPQHGYTHVVRWPLARSPLERLAVEGGEDSSG